MSTITDEHIPSISDNNSETTPTKITSDSASTASSADLPPQPPSKSRSSLKNSSGRRSITKSPPGSAKTNRKKSATTNIITHFAKSTTRSVASSPARGTKWRLSNQEKSNRTRNLFFGNNRLSHSLTELDRKRCWSKFYTNEDDNVKKVLEAVETDQQISTGAHQKRKRRTVLVSRDPNERFGFTVQTYMLHNESTGDVEQISYIDYVDLNSAADICGLRAGDIIVSINGQLVKDRTHEGLVEYIQTCESMRMVLLFEDCVHKVQLCGRALRLKRLLREKELELRNLEVQEYQMLSKANFSASASSMTSYETSDIDLSSTNRNHENSYPLFNIGSSRESSMRSTNTTPGALLENVVMEEHLGKLTIDQDYGSDNILTVKF